MRESTSSTACAEIAARTIGPVQNRLVFDFFMPQARTADDLSAAADLMRQETVGGFKERDNFMAVSKRSGRAVHKPDRPDRR